MNKTETPTTRKARKENGGSRSSAASGSVKSYRRHDWLDTKTMTPKFGIQVKLVGWEVRWLHCAEDGKPLLFDTEEERDAKLKEIRRRKSPNSQLSREGQRPSSGPAAGYPAGQGSK